MTEWPKRFKTRKSWNEFGHSHFLTFSTYDRRPYLADDRVARLFAKNINKAAEELEFVVLAYVFMPDHAHLLIHPIREVYSMDGILQAMKQGTGQVAKNKGWISTRLWLPGGGYDSNLSNSFARRLAISYIHMNPDRKEIVDDPFVFRWSSANWFVTGEQGDVECRLLSELWET